MKTTATLFYIHDPMCSWCYGFKAVLNTLLDELPNKIEVQFLLGGLAADSNETMSDEMQQSIKLNWHKIEQTIPDIKFNYNFWQQCTPRRSSYASCRAVIAAKQQHVDYEIKMINAIQQAYYLDALNPSDYSVLYTLAKKLDLDLDRFKKDIHSTELNNTLKQQISLSRKIGADSFPSLYLLSNKTYYPIVLDYNNADIIIEHLKHYIKS